MEILYTLYRVLLNLKSDAVSFKQLDYELEISIACALGTKMAAASWLLGRACEEDLEIVLND